MSNIIDITEAEINEAEIEMESQESGIEDSRAGVYVILSLSAVAGLWGTACLVCGIGNCASVASLGRGLVTAITGM